MEIRAKWFELKGDETLALDWPLDENSHVWEIGGYEGRWAQQIWDKFHCHITIFEPQFWAVERLLKRFEGNEKIDIRPYGLWTQKIILALGNYHTDGASLVKDDGREEKQLGIFRDYYYEIYGSRFPIDLMLMNIEGGEFALLPAMIASGIIANFNYFWCQFHPDESGNVDVLHYIENGMKKTHDLLWDCYPTAVAWRKK